MFCLVELSRSGLWPRVVMALVTIGLAGCSTDFSRLNESPFNSHSNPDVTGAVPPGQAAPADRVESRPLLPQDAQLPAPHRPSGAGYGAYGPASHSSTPSRPTTMAAAEVTGSVASRPAPSGSWSWEGGAAITVAPGETIDVIARRYGVPVSVIMQANNISPPGTVHSGQPLVIPRYVQSPAANQAPATRGSVAPKSAPATAMSPAGNPGIHVVAPGETLTKISHLYGKKVSEIAKANNIQATAKLNIGDRLMIPGARVSAAKPKATPIQVVQGAQPKPGPAPAEPEPAVSASVFTQVADGAAATASAKAAEAAGGLPKFRWPANGRVISGFGPTTNGQQNDGINIALPENTPVKAAEDGVVAYAGNELKGYGNLVLVRHPNGYVTAYAHAKELLVKRGDQVKRGQPIARSGQTGNVNAPQLHFEIRKGASPLDPIKFLNGA
jgi:murein DD-endopeptidase MepM/ murein hydrolase activator NlpD